MEKIFSEERAYRSANAGYKETLSIEGHELPLEAICWVASDVDKTIQPFEQAFETSDDRRLRLGEEARDALVDHLKSKPRAPRKPKAAKPRPPIVRP